jgi:hypothetical protein
MIFACQIHEETFTGSESIKEDDPDLMYSLNTATSSNPSFKTIITLKLVGGEGGFGWAKQSRHKHLILFLV